MTKRHPNITIHRHSLSIVQEPERLRMARRGELVHQAIRFLCDEAGTRHPTGKPLASKQIMAPTTTSIMARYLASAQRRSSRLFGAPWHSSAKTPGSGRSIRISCGLSARRSRFPR